MKYKALFLFPLLLQALACGYSEEQWRAKLREIDGLKQELAAEAAENQRFQKAIADARARVEQLKSQLSAAGVDVANLKKNVSDQAKALEEYKRRAAQLEAIKQRFEALRNKLKSLMDLGLKVVVRRNRMVIQLPGDVLFDSGRESLKKGGKEILAKLAEVIRQDSSLNSRDFQVAGHTDSRPYKVGIFKDNWGLSVMRAREVVAFLVDPKQGKLSANHWSAAGYGATDPVASNEDDAGRQQNRRCEVVVLPKISEMLDLKSLSQ